MIDKIVGFGCSWIHGDEIEHPNPSTDKERRLYREENCTLGQFASLMGVKKVFNYGISGGSLQSTMWEFVKYKEYFDENTLIVIGLTQASRQSWFNKDERSPYMHSHWNHDHHTWNEFIKFYLVHSDCEQLWDMNYQLATELFTNYCSANDFKLLQFNVFPAPSRVKGVPSWNARGFIHDMHHKHGNCLAPGYHPNEKGSKFLAEKLLQELNSGD